MALSRTLAVRSVIRSASSMMTTRHGAFTGADCAVPTRSRTSSMAMTDFCVDMIVSDSW